MLLIQMFSSDTLCTDLMFTTTLYLLGHAFLYWHYHAKGLVTACVTAQGGRGDLGIFLCQVPGARLVFPLHESLKTLNLTCKIYCAHTISLSLVHIIISATYNYRKTKWWRPGFCKNWKCLIFMCKMFSG